MKRAISLILCILMLQNSWAKSNMKVEAAPRVDNESWEVDDASLKKSAVSMLVFGVLFSLATVVFCVFIPGLPPEVTSSGSSS